MFDVDVIAEQRLANTLTDFCLNHSAVRANLVVG